MTVGLTGFVHAQEESFPSDWQQLDAKTLTEEANQHWGDLDDATKKAVSVHAWSTFLTDPAFIADEPWETVRMTVSRFGSKNHFDKWLADAVSQQAYEQMQQRILERVDQETAVVGEGTIMDVREADRLLAAIAIDKQNRPELFQQWLDNSGWKGWNVG